MDSLSYKVTIFFLSIGLTMYFIFLAKGLTMYILEVIRLIHISLGVKRKIKSKVIDEVTT